MASSDFEVDAQIRAVSDPVGDLPLCRVLLQKDANYPWLLLLPRRPRLIEFSDLPRAERHILMDEITAVGDAVLDLFDCEKLNVAALGLAVRQLHVNVIGRRADDAAWPRPIWGVAAAGAYDPAERDRRVAGLAARLQLVPVPD